MLRKGARPAHKNREHNMPKTEITLTFYGPDAETQAEMVKHIGDVMKRTIRQPEYNLERGHMEYTISDQVAGGRADSPSVKFSGGK